jgi:hypothetical protein
MRWLCVPMNFAIKKSFPAHPPDALAYRQGLIKG